MSQQGRDPRLWTISPPETIRRFIAARRKRVLYFAGYGELGYQDQSSFRSIARDVLGESGRDDVLVLAGTLLREGGHDGVAEVFAIAREMGIETSGIHPSAAMGFAETHRVSPHCDHVFFVEDATWGGFLEGSGEPSPTLRLHLEVSDEAIVIGGGKHAADELRAFSTAGKPVRYFAAEMNHAFARGWAERAGVSISDMRGAALQVWQGFETHSI